MSNQKIQEITTLEQLDECLAACRPTPASEVMDVSGKSFYKLKCRDFNYPNGTVQRREYVDKRPATMVVPEDPNGNFIMVIQPTALVEEGSLIEFPSGYAEPGEASMETGVREMLEETGMTTELENITDLGCHYQDPGLVRQPVHVYLAEYCEQHHRPKPDGGEYIKLYKVSKVMFLHMLFAGYIRDANTYIAAMKAFFKLGCLEA